MSNKFLLQLKDLRLYCSHQPTSSTIGGLGKGEPERGRMGEGRMREDLMSFYGNPMCSLNVEQFTCWRLLVGMWENPVSGH